MYCTVDMKISQALISSKSRHMYQLPPIANEKVFEELICDLFNSIENTSSFDLYGNRGQFQNGIDVYSLVKETAIQCKKVDIRRSEGKVIAQLEKDLINSLNNALKAGLGFKKFILASTFKAHVNLQNLCARLSEESAVEVEYWSWNKIERYLLSSNQLFAKYYKNYNFLDTIELANISMSSDCAWEADPSTANAFWTIGKSRKSVYPIFDLTFINHSNDTVLLTSVDVKIQDNEYSSFNGIGGIPGAGVLKPLAKYKVEIESWNGVTHYKLPDPIYAEAKKPFRFQIQLIHEFDKGLVGFSFNFNQLEVIAPIVYLNCSEDQQGIAVRYLD